MPGYRIARINSMMSKELSEIIRDVKDYRVSSSFVSITGVDCAQDLKSAKVFFSVLSGDPKEVKKGLESAHGYIRGRLSQSMDLRETPALRFVYDQSLERGSEMSSVFKTIEKELKEADLKEEKEKGEEE